jgi:hypothetical protein
MRKLLSLNYFIAMLFAAVSSSASSGSGEYRLEWPVRGEFLVYHSCGCADSCWVAEVRNTQTKVVKYRLRCDCEKLLFSQPGREREYVVSESCSSINESDKKSDQIRQQLETFIHSDNVKKRQ